jgi:hypothetical protein
VKVTRTVTDVHTAHGELQKALVLSLIEQAERIGFLKRETLMLCADLNCVVISHSEL